MQSDLLNGLLETVDIKIFQIVLQLIIIGTIVVYIKDLNSRVMNYYKLKMSDFGRGTKIKIGDVEGYIHEIGFNQVEIDIDDENTALIPVEKFISSVKVITVKRTGRGK